jgi:hypothetical protein
VAAPKTKKFTREIDARLYNEFMRLLSRMGRASGMFLSRRSGFIYTMWFRPSTLSAGKSWTPSSKQWRAIATSCSCLANKCRTTSR